MDWVSCFALTMSVTESLPPGWSTRKSSWKTRCFRKERLMTPLEMTTSTESSGRGSSSMAAWWHSSSPPTSATLSRAFRHMTGLRSTPTTRPDGPTARLGDLLEANLATATVLLGPEHEQTRNARELAAALDHELGRFDRALARTDTVIQEKIAAHQGDHPGVVYSLNVSGEILLDAGRPREAAERHREALEVGGRLGEAEGVYAMLARHGLARVALAEGDTGAAESLLAHAMAIANRRLREDHRYTLDLHRTRARLLLVRGRPAEAAEILLGVVEVERRVRPSPHPRIGETLALLAWARDATGAATEGRELRRQALSEMIALPDDHPRRREATGQGDSVSHEPSASGSTPLQTTAPLNPGMP